MRVCIVGPATSAHVQRWAEALLERGHRVSLLSTSPEIADLPAALRQCPIYTIPTSRPDMGRAQRFATLLRGWARLPGLLRVLKPDIVHLHSLPVPAATPFLYRTRNMIVSAWGSDVVQRDRRKEQLYPLLLAGASRVTATSHYLAGIARTYLRAPRRVDVVAFGVDPQRFTPRPQLLAAPVIGTLRRLERVHGTEILIEALPRIAATHPALRTHIGGEGSQRVWLQARIERLKLTGKVRFHGHVEYQELPNFLQQLRLFVVPSRQESFGVAAVEAQACGLPVVATAVGGLPEVVADGRTGLLVPPEQPDALAAAITSLLDDPQRCIAMGRAARQWVLDRYHWEDNVDQMLQIYSEVRCGAS